MTAVRTSMAATGRVLRSWGQQVRRSQAWIAYQMGEYRRVSRYQGQHRLRPGGLNVLTVLARVGHVA